MCQVNAAQLIVIKGIMYADDYTHLTKANDYVNFTQSCLSAIG